MRKAILLAAALLLGSCSLVQPKVLTVCADPNNLPFSNKAGQGFENKLAEMIAADLHARLDYIWWAQRRGYVRNTLNERKCDFWPGVGSNVEMLATSQPYYRSTYMFVTRATAPLTGLTLDDPRLKHLKIGVQMVGNDGINTPPAHALARRGMADNIRGYMLYGDYAKPNPPAEIVQAVERDDVDVALVWGPLAGYFAAQSRVPLRLEPVTPWLDDMQWPMQFDISVGVQKTNQPLLKDVDRVLRRRRGDIQRLLASYHVPLVQQ
ncbi:quinoprotein dehydrogenase-associated probable ABC transporter substrate-binding protein [Sphingomonas sp. F9_3S_D5_B_2]